MIIVFPSVLQMTSHSFFFLSGTGLLKSLKTFIVWQIPVIKSSVFIIHVCHHCSIT